LQTFQQADDEVLAGQDVTDIVPIGDGAFFLIELEVVPQTIVIMFSGKFLGVINLNRDKLRQ
jgi:hypothetical protein